MISTIREIQLRPIPFTDVRGDDDFSTPAIETLRTVTLDRVSGHLVETDRTENVRIATP